MNARAFKSCMLADIIIVVCKQFGSRSESTVCFQTVFTQIECRHCFEKNILKNKQTCFNISKHMYVVYYKTHHNFLLEIGNKLEKREVCKSKTRDEFTMGTFYIVQHGVNFKLVYWHRFALW